jgi:L-serine deaminase
MFTHDPARTTGFVRAVGVATDGTEHRLSPELSGGTVEVIHAAQTLATEVRRGRAGELCAEIAERVARSGLDVAAVMIVTDRYDIVTGLQADDPQPVSRDEHARCQVGPS